MNKRMTKRKRLGLTLDILLLTSIFIVNDITYLRLIGTVIIV
jgi:hypothetical protein